MSEGHRDYVKDVNLPKRNNWFLKGGDRNMAAERGKGARGKDW